MNFFQNLQIKRRYIVIGAIVAIIYGGSLLWYLIGQNREVVKFFQADGVVLLDTLEEENIMEAIVHTGYGGRPFYLSPDAQYLLYFNNQQKLVLENMELQTSEVLQNLILSGVTLTSREISEDYSSDPEKQFVVITPKWSPDSRYILIPAANELYILDVKTKAFTKASTYPLFNEWKISDQNIYQHLTPPKNYEWWGERIIYLCENEVNVRSPNLCIVSLDGQAISRKDIFQGIEITEDGTFPFRFAGSPSGKYAIVHYDKPLTSVFIDENGNIIRNYGYTQLAWSPDEESFAHILGGSGQSSIIIDPSGGDETTRTEMRKVIDVSPYEYSYLTWTEQGIFVANDDQAINADPQTITATSISLPHVDLGHDPPQIGGKYYSFERWTNVSPSGRFMVEVFETDPVFTLAGEAPKYIRLAAKDIAKNQVVELMWDALLEGGGTEEQYSFHFVDSNSMVIIRKQAYSTPDSGVKRRYFIYKVDLASLPAFNQ